MSIEVINSCVNRSCIVISMDNEVLFNGVINEFDDNSLIIKADIFTNNLPIGSTVKVFSMTSDAKDVIFKGYIIFSDSSGIKLQKVSLINSDDGRKFFRVNMKLETEIVLDITENMIETSEIDDFIFNVIVEDLSIGGCSFSTNKELATGQGITMKILLDDKCMMLSSIIRRRIKEDGENKVYGAEFLLLTDAEETVIEAFVTRKNRDNIVNFRNMLKKR